MTNNKRGGLRSQSHSLSPVSELNSDVEGVVNEEVKRSKAKKEESSRHIWISSDRPSCPSAGSRIVQLPHPRTGNASPFVFNPEVGCVQGQVSPLCSLHQVPSRDLRSWFVGDSVIQDGSLMICSPYNPLYILIPILETRRSDGTSGTSQGVFQSLSDLLYDERYPVLNELIQWERLPSVLETICQVRDASWFRLDDEKVMAWLIIRIEKVLSQYDTHASLLTPLECLDVPLVQVLDLEVVEKRKRKRIVAVIDAMEDVLSSTWMVKLKSHYGITDSDQENTGGSKIVYFENIMHTTGQNNGSKTAAKKGPAEKKRKGTAPPPGSKSISSFFKKKT